ncbi:hypothetical protein J3L18_31185 [Mucilaginibacter gossypii]|nr:MULTISPECIES: hypothetical protein [Mucilaginibacter]WMH62826.1 hypothetical protein J3L18_31185 [Mucilaginibacter gossypii]
MKTPAHFVDKTLLNPTNPLTVNLIGAGGTAWVLFFRWLLRKRL